MKKMESGGILVHLKSLRYFAASKETTRPFYRLTRLLSLAVALFAGAAATSASSQELSPMGWPGITADMTFERARSVLIHQGYKDVSSVSTTAIFQFSEKSSLTIRTMVIGMDGDGIYVGLQETDQTRVANQFQSWSRDLQKAYGLPVSIENSGEKLATNYCHSPFIGVQLISYKDFVGIRYVGAKTELTPCKSKAVQRNFLPMFYLELQHLPPKQPALPPASLPPSVPRDTQRIGNRVHQSSVYSSIDAAYIRLIQCTALVEPFATNKRTAAGFKQASDSLNQLTSEKARSLGVSTDQLANDLRIGKAWSFGLADLDLIRNVKACETAHPFWPKDTAALTSSSPTAGIDVNPKWSKKTQFLVRCTAVARWVHKYGLLTSSAEQKVDWAKRADIVREQLRKASTPEGVGQLELDKEIESIVDGYLQLNIEELHSKTPSDKKVWIMHARECRDSGLLEKSSP